MPSFFFIKDRPKKDKKTPMKTKLILTLTLTSILLTSCGTPEVKPSDKGDAVKVMLQNPAVGSGSTLQVSGQVEAVSHATLSTRMMGYVTKVHVGIGDPIKKGQLLVSIHSADVQAKQAQVHAGIQQATVGYTNAKRDYERFTALFAQQSASQKELDDYTARYEMAGAQLESARAMKREIDAQLAYYNITAPFNGVVTNQFVEHGDMAHPGMPLIALEAPGAFEVLASAPASAISNIKIGQAATVLIQAAHLTLKGHVEQVGSSSSRSGGQYPIKIGLEKNDGLRSGMYATVQFTVEANETVTPKVTIVKEALVTHGDLRGVYTVSQQNTAILRWLRLGSTLGDHIEVLSGLSAEESYILSSEGKLYNGVQVEVGSFQ
jgi:RND family efflux transporter MFP subunit